MQRLIEADCLCNSKKILDVGGGDGTVAIMLVKEYLQPAANITVYNLPYSAEFARRNVEFYECDDQVRVVDGNFLEDKEFPGTYDAIMFNRV